MTDSLRRALGLATVLFAAAVLTTVGLASPADAQPTPIHVVLPGETLYRIASQNGLTVEELRRLNGLQGDAIQVGQRLRLSDGAPRPDPPVTLGETDGGTTPRIEDPAAGGRTVHVVERGETLYRLSLRYNTTVDELRRLNGLAGDQISVGQRLVVGGGAAPTATVPAGPGERRIPALSTAERAWAMDRTTVPSDLVYFVLPGETLYSIAAMYGIASQALIDQNPVTTAPLEAGEMLVLPEAVNPAWADPDRLPPPVQEGLALVYPDVMSGRPTTSGEPYDPLEFTASHRTFPLGTLLIVSNPASGRSTFVRITDTGPVSEAYIMELSAAAASALDLDPNAARRVELRELP